MKVEKAVVIVCLLVGAYTFIVALQDEKTRYVGIGGLIGIAILIYMIWKWT